MQIIRGAVFVKVELAVDVVHVMHHQFDGQRCIAGFDGVDQLAVLIVGTVRAIAGFVLGNDQ